MITLLSIVLPAAVLIKEKEREIVEHLLVMPLVPLEFTIAKVWTYSFIVLMGAMFSLFFRASCIATRLQHGGGVHTSPPLDQALHRWDEAIAAAEKAIALKPDFQLAKNNLAWSISQKKLGVR